MQIRRWQKPGSDEVRYYFDLRFGGAPFLSYSANGLLCDRWIGRDEDGMAHIFAKTQHGRGACRTEDGDWLDRAFGLEGKTFDDWERIYGACLTKRGRFSIAQYAKIDPSAVAA